MGGPSAGLVDIYICRCVTDFLKLNNRLAVFRKGIYMLVYMDSIYGTI